MILAWDNFNTFSKQKSKQKSKQIQIFFKKHLKFFKNIPNKLFWWLFNKMASSNPSVSVKEIS